MTREEAIHYLERIKQEYDCSYEEDALDMAIKALEQEPCKDAISRDAVEEIINDIRDCISVEGYWAILERLKKLPPVKPQERTGHWNLFHTTEHGMREDSYFKCNRCNYESYKEYNFCPDCGAKMVEPQERSVRKLRKCVIEEQSKHYYIGQRVECVTFTALKRLAFRLSSQGYGVSVIGLSDIEDHVLTITAGKEQRNE